MANRLDILILGATGFTGKHCIPFMHKFAKSDGRNLTWGIAGRSEEKLKEVLAEMSKRVGADLSTIPIVICNIKEDVSLKQMAEKAKVVVNCCGPYRFLGEPVVKACIEAGTHHVDVSGEPQYMERVQLEYYEAAKKKGVYIVSACGLDSIPTDMGLVFIQKNFEGTLNSVVTYIEAWQEGDRLPGPTVNYGTWESLVYGAAYYNELKDLRKKLNKEKMPTFQPKLQASVLPYKPSVVDGWSLPFPGSDRSVMRRTQRYFYEEENKRPVQVDTQIVVKSFLHVVMMIIAAAILKLMVIFSFGRRLLLDYPEIFTFGMFSKSALPSEEAIEKTWFQVTLYGEGWSEKLADKNDEYKTPCDKYIVGRVKGKNPGYGATCISLLGAAIMIASEKDKLPADGGVYTPGIAFEKTSLIEFLNENGVTFDIIEQKQKS